MEMPHNASERLGDARVSMIASKVAEGVMRAHKLVANDVTDFIDMVRDYAYDAYPRHEAEEALDGLEEIGGRPSVKSVREAVQSLKGWGMTRNEFMDMVDDDSRLKRLW